MIEEFRNVEHREPSVDSRYLRSAGHDLKVPIRLAMTCEGGPAELVCTRVMRVLPGKRLVCSGKWNEQAVVAKFFLDPWRGRRHCDREERGLQTLREVGIETPPLLFKGLVAPDNAPVLGFQRLEPARDLGEVWTRVEDDKERIGVMSRAIKVIADQHEKGLKQEDVHLKNFLLVGDEVYSIDGAGLDIRRKGKPLTINASLRNLAFFFAQFCPPWNHVTSEAFQLYLERRGWPQKITLTPFLVKRVRDQRRKAVKEYLSKVYRNCSAMVCKRTWDWFMICKREYYSEEMGSLLLDPDCVIQAGRLLKDGNTSTVGWFEVDGRRLVVKRYNIKNARHALKRCLRRSRAWISWGNAHRLVALGVKTPEPVALIEKRWGPFRWTSYFITDYVEGDDAYSVSRQPKQKKAEQQTLAEQFGKMLQALADASISHGDLKATNFILSGGVLFVVDLDAMRKHWSRHLFCKAFRRDCERLMRNWKDLPQLREVFRRQLAGLDV